MRTYTSICQILKSCSPCEYSSLDVSFQIFSESLSKFSTHYFLFLFPNSGILVTVLPLKMFCKEWYMIEGEGTTTAFNLS